jgi:hypothetical protein
MVIYQLNNIIMNIMENKYYMAGLTRVEERLLNQIFETENELYNVATKLGQLNEAQQSDTNLVDKYQLLENQMQRFTNNYLSYNTLKK